MYVEQNGPLRVLRACERGCELLTGLVAAAAARAAVLKGCGPGSALLRA